MSGTGPVNAHLSEDAWRDAAALVAAYMRMDDEGQAVIVRHADPAALTAGAVAMAASVLAGWAISLGVRAGRVVRLDRAHALRGPGRSARGRAGRLGRRAVLAARWRSACRGMPR